MSKSTTELVPPDNGYAYVILFAVVVNLTIFNAYTTNYGIIFKDFFRELHFSSADITSLNGVSGVCSALSGFFTAPLLQILSKRQISIVGTIIFNVSIFCTAFVRDKTVFFILQGFFTSLANGLLFNISTSIVNDYFLKKRFLAISLSQTLSAASCLLAPQFYQWSIDQFGHRTTLIWITAISLHLFVGSTLFQPVEWHMKKVDISPKETEIKLLLEETKAASIKIKSDEVNKKEENKDGDKQSDTVLRSMMKSLIDMDVIYNFMLSMSCWGPTLCMAMEISFLVMLPQAFQSYGWDETEVAWIFSFMAFGDLVMRVCLIFFSKWFNKVGSKRTYIFGIYLACFSRFGLLIFHNKSVIYLIAGVMGVSKCILMVVLLMVISESVSLDKYIAAMGCFMATFGVTNITLGPTLGFIRDYTGSYTLTFCIISAVTGLVASVWTICLIVNRKKKIDDVA